MVLTFGGMRRSCVAATTLCAIQNIILVALIVVMVMQINLMNLPVQNAAVNQQTNTVTNAPSPHFEREAPRDSNSSTIMQSQKNDTSPRQISPFQELFPFTWNLETQSYTAACREPQDTNPTVAPATHTVLDLSKCISIFTNLLHTQDRPTGEEDEHFCTTTALY